METVSGSAGETVISASEYSFSNIFAIKYFDIPKEKLKEAVSSANLPEGWIISPSDVDVIYSGDDDLIKQTFVNEYALFYNAIASVKQLFIHSLLFS